MPTSFYNWKREAEFVAFQRFSLHGSVVIARFTLWLHFGTACLLRNVGLRFGECLRAFRGKFTTCFLKRCAQQPSLCAAFVEESQPNNGKAKAKLAQVFSEARDAGATQSAMRSLL